SGRYVNVPFAFLSIMTRYFAHITAAGPVRLGQFPLSIGGPGIARQPDGSRDGVGGRTPVLTSNEASQLLESIDTATLLALRDRAVIDLMVYSCAAVAAALGMKVDNYYVEGRKAWFRLHEKGGRRHEVSVHHNAADYMDAYLAAVGFAEHKKS